MAILQKAAFDRVIIMMTSVLHRSRTGLAAMPRKEIVQPIVKKLVY